jgi:ribonucleoside-diphosphate reductase beta chain
MALLDPRTAYLPFEYPQVSQFIEPINHTYWLHSEVNFDSDALEFSRLPKSERDILMRTMLAISQIEVSVKLFWGNLHTLFPKPELHNLSMTMGEVEARHAEAYSRLLVVLGFEKEFQQFLKNKTAMDRFSWLTKPRNNSPIGICHNIAIFAVLMENVSLFSQFLIIMSYRRHLGVMKNVANIVEWTKRDEEVHFETGAWLVSIMRNEYPEIDAAGFSEQLREVAEQALEHEIKMVDFILGNDVLPFISRDVIIEFIKDRLNRSLAFMGIDLVFVCDGGLLKETRWFYEMLSGTSHKDFFATRPVEYSVKDVSFGIEELW